MLSSFQIERCECIASQLSRKTQNDYEKCLNKLFRLQDFLYFCYFFKQYPYTLISAGRKVTHHTKDLEKTAN